MRTVTKIACRIVGAAGMGLAVYDATKVSGHFARSQSRVQQSKYLEKIYFNSRTIDDISYVSNNIRKNTFDARTKNPAPSIIGKVKGAIHGFVYSLANNLLTIGCSAFAILSKGTMAKVGAIGVGLSTIYNIIRNGYGIGKQHPMK